MSQPSHNDHWQRFRRLMWLMLGLAALGVVALFIWMWATGAPFHFHMMMAMSLAVVFSLLLAGALMGLVFLSSRSGHDASIERPDHPEGWQDE